MNQVRDIADQAIKMGAAMSRHQAQDWHVPAFRELCGMLYRGRVADKLSFGRQMNKY